MVRSYLTIEASKDGVSVDNLQEILAKLREIDEEFDVFTDEGHTEDETSIDYEDTINTFSKANPELLLCVEGSSEGVGLDSCWREYFQNGKYYQVAPEWPEFDEENLH